MENAPFTELNSPWENCNFVENFWFSIKKMEMTTACLPAWKALGNLAFPGSPQPSVSGSGLGRFHFLNRHMCAHKLTYSGRNWDPYPSPTEVNIKKSILDMIQYPLKSIWVIPLTFHGLSVRAINGSRIRPQNSENFRPSEISSKTIWSDTKLKWKLLNNLNS